MKYKDTLKSSGGSNGYKVEYVAVYFFTVDIKNVLIEIGNDDSLSETPQANRVSFQIYARISGWLYIYIFKMGQL